MRNHRGPSVDDSHAELTAEQQQRLISILENCLQRQRLQGAPFASETDRIKLLESNADLGDALIDALDGLLWVGKLSPESSCPPFASLQIQGYELLEEIGRGGMGVVYAARRLADSSEVAIKVLLSGQRLAKNLVERFHREAKAAASVCHPSIVPVYETSSQGDLCYFAMKRIRGESLANWIARRRGMGAPISSLESKKYLAREFAQVADGLYRVHQSGILHRDIKPSNLLLDLQEHLWILDFGLASIADSETLTRSGDLIGTFRYMSPEQAAGRKEPLDSRTDIYSLGLTIYEAFTLTNPFSKYEGAALLKAIQSPAVEPPRRFCPDIPKDLETIILRAIRPDRNARYSSARELALDLERFANGESIEALRVTWRERASAACKKYPDRVLAGVCAMVVATGAMGVHSAVVQRERDRTRTQWARGNENYEQARAAVDSLGFRVSEQLAALPGAEALRQEVLQETLKYYEAFITRSNHDPLLQRDVAETRWKMANLIGMAGSKEDAIEALALAADELHQAWTETADSNLLLLAIQSKCELAGLLGDQGRLVAAQKELDLANAWAEGVSPSIDKAFTESLLWNSMAILAYKRGDMRAASTHALRAVERLDIDPIASSTTSPKDINRFQQRMRHSIADTLHNLGFILAEQGYIQVAERVTARSLAMRTAAPSTPHSSDDLRRLALSYNGLASLAWKQGNVEEAIRIYSFSAELLEQAVDRLPGLLGPRRELAVTLNNLGMAQSSAQRLDLALKTFQSAIGIATSLADTDSSNAEAAKHAAGIWNNMAMVQFQLGEKRQALESMQKAVYYQQCVARTESASEQESQLLKRYESMRESWAIEQGPPYLVETNG
ncbi:Serine/threonine-protein kinase PrkC [Pirellula sp. SH-Sr6A]|uniref:serine/threonine-protein kinase n=1 Tax=Pirellula sp. SH-Sr6A TaxID=1632865 RepID=UPI00078BF5BF|nr:serine/threonine-protein kinase [Pirellula sp. SH-Sr6A]AMV33236.1 Serine/threonine-protein kinase PrkC [Pirellula sp. SH-Sr6A]